MSLPFLWSPLAEDDLVKNLHYLKSKWGLVTANSFLDRVQQSLDAIQNNPASYYMVNKKNRIHKFLLNNNITIYYQINKNNISLITFWNNRRDPGKLKRVLRSRTS